MKPKQPNIIKFLTICIAPAVLLGLTVQSAHAISPAWDAGGGTNNINNSLNWTGDVSPIASGDTATWNGTVAGDLVLNWTAVFGPGFGSVGTNVDITAAQTSSVLIGSASATTSTNADQFNMGNLTIASGAGAFTFGDGTGFDDMILRSVTTPPTSIFNTLTNNSSNTATFASNVYFNSGNGDARTLNFEGSGNWQFNSALRFSNGSTIPLTVVKNGAGTLTFSGPAVTGGPSSYVINAGTLKVAGAGLLGGTATLPGNIANNAAFSYESSASQTISGVISGSGAFGQTAGNLILTGVNTYSAVTAITGGTLNVSGTGSIESSSGITVNGATAKYLHTSTTNSTRNIALTQGTVSGTGTIGAVTVANGTGQIANGSGSSAALTIGSLAFSGAGAVTVTDDGDNTTSGVIVSGALTTTPANGTVTVNASNSFWAGGTTYKLISAGSFGGLITNFTKGTISGLTTRQSATLVLTGTTVGVSIAGDSPKWSGLDNSNWVVGSTGANGNWKLITGGAKTDYITGDVVLFDDTPTNTTVTISPANVSPAVVNFNNSSKNYTINGALGIAAGAVNKSGTGSVTISTPNTYSGGTTINAGTIALGGAGTLGATSGSLTIADGTLNLGGTSQTVGSLAITGATLIDNGTLTATGLAASNPSGFDATIASGLNLGSGNLGKSGDGTLTILGTTTYSGTTTISGGILTLNGSGSLGSTSGVTLSGGSLDLGGTSQTTSAITISAAAVSGDTITNGSITPTALNVTSTSGVAAVSANILGTAGITVSGGLGTLSLSGANTFTGPLNLTANATVMIEGGSNSGGGAITYNSFGTTVTMNAGSYLTSGITASSNSNSRSLNLNGGELASAGNIFADLLAIQIGFNGSTLKSANAAGITVFDFDNTIPVYGIGASFDTTVGDITIGTNTNASAGANLPKITGAGIGTVTILGGKHFVSGFQYTGHVDIQNSSTWNLNGITSSVGGLSGDGSVTSSPGAAVLTISTDSSYNYSGNIAGGANLSLVMQGTGTQTLSGNNTYLGDTTVLGGVLDVTGNAIPNTGKLVIDGGVVNVTGTEVVGSLYFGAAVQATGTWGATGSGATHIDDTHFTGPGKIQVGSVGGYASWASTNGLTAGVNDGTSQDPDFDGIPNLLEYVLGGLPIGPGASNTAILPVQTLDATNVTLTFKRSDLSEVDTTQVVQISTNLGTWTNFATVGATTAAPVTVTEDSPTADLDTVSVLIPRAANAVNGKLFVRLQAVKQP